MVKNKLRKETHTKVEQDLTSIQTILPNWSKIRQHQFENFKWGAEKLWNMHSWINDQTSGGKISQWRKQCLQFRHFRYWNKHVWKNRRNMSTFSSWSIRFALFQQLYIVFEGCRDSCYKGKWFKCPKKLSSYNVFLSDTLPVLLMENLGCLPLGESGSGFLICSFPISDQWCIKSTLDKDSSDHWSNSFLWAKDPKSIILPSGAQFQTITYFIYWPERLLAISPQILR